jgi:Spy/CpxP family protein refolding chaperone
MKKAVGMFIAMLILAVSTAPAQPGPGPGAMRRQGNPEKMMMGALNLTGQQKTDVQKLHADMERSMVKVQSAVRLARIDLRQLLDAEKLDRNAIEKKVREVSNLQQEAKTALIDHLFAVYAMLTPEQQKTFKEHMARRLEDGPGPGIRQRMERRQHRMMEED